MPNPKTQPSPAKRRDMLVERRSRDMASIERRGRNPSAQIMRGLLAELDRFYLRRDMSIESILAVKLAPMIDLLTDAMLMAHLTSMVNTQTAAQQHTTGKAFGVFDSAIARFQRLADMSPRQLATLRNKYQNASFVTVKGMSGDLEKKIQRSLLNTAKRELSGKAAIRVFRRSLAASGIDMRANVVEAVYRTQTAIAYGSGQREANADPAVAEILWGYEYNTAGDDRVRPTHEAMDGRRAPKDHPLWDTWFPPAGWNCFTGDTVVSGAFTGATRARYDGPITIIETRQGMRLSVTPNHPIATRRGWVAAKDIQHGDDLVCHRPSVQALVLGSLDRIVATPLELLGAVDKQKMPATIKDVFDSFCTQGVKPVTSHTSPLDFHGDAAGFDGQIDVVVADGQLHRNGQATRDQFVMQDIDATLTASANATGHRTGEFHLLGGGLATTTGSSPSGGTLTLDDIPPLRTHGSPLNPLLLGRAAKLNAAVAEDSVDRDAGYPVFLRNLIDAGSGEIQFDRVRRVNTRAFVGHVYDLQSVSSDVTGNGWMVAQGIVTSNCRCVATEIFIDDPASMRRTKLPPEYIGPKDRRVRVVPDKGFTTDFALPIR